MNTNGKQSGRSFRRSRKRAVSPIIATILLVAITVVLAAVLYILISGLTKGPGNTPIGTALALGSPKEASAGANNYYNFSVQSAGGGILFNNLNFQVINPSGQIVTPTAAWSLTVVNLFGTSVGTYALTGASAGTWTAGGTTALSSSQTICLNAASSLSGDKLVVAGAGSYQGSISISIP